MKITLLKRVSVIFAVSISSVINAQTWTDVSGAAAYAPIAINANKDGGHAWADYDLDGDLDLIVNLNSGTKLLENDISGTGVFIDRTAALTDGMGNSTERSAVWGDLNGDGYPDFIVNDHTKIEIRLQNPLTHVFGDGLGGTAHNLINGVDVSNGFNAEGIGLLDYDQDGDLDFFIDNHNFGTDLLQNDGAGGFTHVTPGTGTILGLDQTATDGDYGSATDFNNDGFVDIMGRKRNQNDFFQNLGGTFANAADIADASNSNKGAASLYDFDNDGDFDIFWTENGLNQIFQNNGGTWLPIAESFSGIFDNAAGGLANYSGPIEGLACGDVDNDGDIDIFLAGPDGYLWLNNYNNGAGAAMTFTLSNQAFPINGNGEGCTFVDIDDDGDLDLYISSSVNSSHLYRNNLTGATTNDFMFVDVMENRAFAGFAGLTGAGNERYAHGATVRLIDCDGNVLSGVREVNGGNGHGTQDVPRVHFGLPLGATTPVIVQVFYPAHNSSGARVVYRQQVTPSTLGTGGARVITMYPTVPANNTPIGQPDNITIDGSGNPVTFNPQANNGNGVDSDPDGDPMSVGNAVGNGPLNGVVVVNSSTSITYTPSVPVMEIDCFEYYLSDNTTCPFESEVDTVKVTITLDTDGDNIPDNIDIDDDNDGILDNDECSFETNSFGPFTTANTTWSITGTGGTGSAVLNSMTHNDGTNTITYTDFIFPDLYEESFVANTANDIYEVNNNVNGNGGGVTGNNISNPNWNNLILPAFQSPNLNYFQKQDHNIIPTDYYTLTYNVPVAVYGNEFLLISERGGNNPTKIQAFDVNNNNLGPIVSLAANSATYLNNTGVTASNGQTIEIAVYSLTDFAPAFSKIKYFEITSNSTGDGADGKVIIISNSPECADTDGDGIPNSVDLDSDNDGITDVVENGGSDPDNDGMIGTGIPTDTDMDGLADIVDATPATGEAGSNGSPVADQDGDGVPNSLDLDSDNDGILDTKENGLAGDANNDGVIDGTVDVDNDGILDVVDEESGFGDAGNTTTTPNTDSNGLPDYLDIDADDDGIVDVIEGQSTVGYTAPSGNDADGDGIDDAFDNDDAAFGGNANNGLTPENTDGATDNPDYTDLDTDDDGKPDTVEGWDTSNNGTANTTASGNDSDNDGLDDAYDSDGTGLVDNGGSDNNGSVPTGFPDVNNPGGDLDWRQTCTKPTSPTAGNNGPVCLTNTLSLTASTVAGATYSWTGPNSYTSTSQNPTVSASSTAAMAGVYGVVAISSSGCVSDTSETTVVITSPGNAGTVSGTNAICVGSTTTFSTTGSGGTWSSGTVGVATVNAASGLVTGVTAGTSIITYTVPAAGGCPAVTATRTVTVTAPGNAGTVSGTNAICVGSTTTFSTTGSGGTWSSGTVGVATVNAASGLVTGVTAGTSIITYTVPAAGGCPAVTATRTVTVTAPGNAGTVSGTNAICVGSTTTFSTTGSGGTWSSGTVGVATVNAASGLVTGVTAGTSIITYTVPAAGGCPAVTATRTVTVTAPGNAGTISGTNAICVGSTSTFSTTGSGGTWSSGTVGVATVNAASGLVTGVTAGTSIITYTVPAAGGCPAVTATRTVTVTAPGNAGTISGTNAICVGSTTTFSTTGSGGTWSSGTAAVAIVNSTSGLVTGVTAGTSIITYTVPAAGGCPAVTATRTVTVTAPGNAGTISGTNAICVGSTTTFSTTGSGGTWSSGTVGVATVNAASGLVTGVTAGTSIITYTVPAAGGCPAVTATRTVTVTTPGNAGTISGTNAICVGSTTTFSTTGSGGTWSSGTVGVATVNAASGLVTGVTAGTSIITYTVPAAGGCPAVTATRTVTVTAPGNAGTISGTNAICVGSTTTFSTTGSGGTWSSGTVGVATVNAASGLVTGVTAGTSIITYTVPAAGGCPAVTATRTVTVTAPGNAGTVSGTNAICVGSTTTFSTTGSGGTWSSGTVGVATVNAASGLVTGVTAGTSIITYTVPAAGGCPAVTATRTVTVTAGPTATMSYSGTPFCTSITTGQSPTMTGTTGGTYSSTAGLTINATSGAITPSSSTVGNYVVSYTIPASGGCPVVVVTTNVEIGLCPPTVVDDVAGTNLTEDGANGVIDIINNDTDTDGTPTDPSNGSGQYVVDLDPTTLGIQTTFTDATGTWTYDPTTGDVTFDPANDYNGTATITYELTDPEGNSDQGDITFTVDPVNDAPSVGNENMGPIDEDEPTATTSPNLTTNNIDPDGTTTTVTTVVSSTGGGTTTITGGGTTIDYTPAPGFNGVDTVIYTVCDNGLPLPASCVNDTLFVTVDAVNDAPSQGNENLIGVTEDDTAPTTTGSLTANNIDPDGTTTTVTTVVSSTGGGTAVITGGGTTIDYTPSPNFNGVDTVIYTVCDNGLPLPAECVNDTLFVTVDPVNDAPSVGNENMGPIDEDEPTATTSPNLTTNNIDPDGTTTTVTTVVSSTGGGTTTITGGGTTIDYTPAPGFNGVDTVVYTVCDNGLPLPASCVNDTLFVTVDAVNDAPSQGNENLIGVTEDDTAPTTTGSLTANNIDPDGTTTTVTTVVSTTGGGTAVITGGGTTIDYTPSPNFNGVDTVIYTVCDNGLPLPAECVNDTLFVTVDPVNDAPSVGNENMGPIDEDEPTATTSPNLTTNNIDPDGTTTTVTTVVSSTGGGTTTITGGGTTIDYTPAPGFNGVDTVIYTVCDNGLPLPASCVNDTLFVTVDAVNDAPSQGNENLIGVTEDDTAPTTTGSLTANNIDPDGTTTTVTTVVSSTGGGTTTITGGGTTIDYTPSPNFNGVDTVIYTVCDNGLPLPAECVNDTLFVTVDPVNDAPSVGNENMGPIDEDEPTATTSPNLTTNNIDPDGTTTTVTTVVSSTGGGTTTITGGGTTIDYTPAPGFNGVDTVIYTVCDNGLPLPASCVNDTLFVTVDAVNDAPVIDNEFISVSVNGSNGGDLTDAGDSDIDGNLVVNTTPIDGPGNGTIIINPDGTYTYTNTNSSATGDTVVVEICDDGTPLPAICVNDTIFITILPTNPPVASADSTTTLEDNAVTFNVTGDDTDSDGTIDNGTVDLDPGTPGIQNTFTSPEGTWTVDANGDVTFTPNQDYNGDATITYTVDDNDGATSNTATLTVTVTPVNDGPIVDNENDTTPEDTSVSGDLTDAGDSDVDGNLVVTTTPVDGPDNGTIVINPDGTYTYTPDSDFNGMDTVVVEICDDGTPTPVICTTDTIFVTVTPVNDPPVADPDSTTTLEDTPVTVNVTGDDTDVDGTIDNTTVDLDPTTPVIDNTFTSPEGTWTVDANGDITFTPNQDFNGDATIDYTVNDNDGGISNVSTVTVTVDPINDPPVVDNEYISVPLGGSTSGDLTDFGDTDVDGNLTATITPLGGPSNGTVLIFPDGSYTYTGNPGFIGMDTVIVEICDDGTPLPIICVTDTIFVTILNTLPPVATDNGGNTLEDTPVTINVTGDDSDPDGTIDNATVDLDPGTPGIQNTFTSPEGTWTVDTNGDVTFTPNQDYNGTATIVYTVNDNDGSTSNTADITIVVDPVNDGPIVDNENDTTPEDTPVSGDLTDAGDSDVDGNLVVSVLPVDGPDSGTIVINPDGTYTYTPDPDFNGNDTIVVQICDDGTPLPVICTTDTIFVTVTPVNDPPVVDNEFISVPTGGSNSGDLTDIGDSDVDGNLVVTTTPVSGPNEGTIVINPDGTYTYTNTNPTATNDTVVVEICDDGTPLPVNCTTDTIFINILNTTPPVASPDSVTTLEEVAVTFNVTGDDTDVDGTIDNSTVDLDPGTPGIQNTFTSPEGTWTVDSNGDVTFTPNANYNGDATIVYTVNDNDGATSNTATLTVTVTPVDDNPIATDNSDNTIEDTPVTFNVTGDDTDSDGTIDPSTVDLDPTTPGIDNAITTPEGTWTVDNNGNVTFTPNQDYNGTATIDYTVEDNDGLTSNVATITVVVDPVNDAPVVDNENDTTPEDTPVSGDLTDAGDSDVDGNLVVTTLPVDGPDNGTIVINPDGTYTYTPDPEFSGNDTIVVEICDDGTPLPAICTTDTIFVTVTPVNDPPVIDNEFISVPTGGSNGGDLTDNGDSDVDGNLVVTTTPVSGPNEGTIVINPDGTYTYTNTNPTATNDTIVVEICDDGTPLPVNCTTDTIFITILNTTPPVATDNDTTTLEDTPITFNVSGDDTDVDGTIDNGTVDLDPSTAGVQTTVTTPEGTWTVDANGDVTFTPSQDFNGVATVDYTVNDNDGAVSNTATITVTVTPVNDEPIVDNENDTTPEDTPVSGDLTDAGDSDVDGNLVVNTFPLDDPDNGTIVINPDGTYTYTPDPDFVGQDTIVVEICDDGTPLPANCTTDTIFVDVTPVNDPPVIDNEFISVQVGGSTSGDLTDIGDTDIDGNLVVTVTPVDQPDNGTIVINPDGTYTYTNTNPTATNDTVVVQICDDGTPLPINCTTDTIFINIVNTIPPVADADSTTTTEDTPVTVNVTGDDTDADGTIDNSTVDLDPGTPGIQNTFTSPEGTWTVDSNGDVTFTPNPNYTGDATIVYTVNDNDGATSNTATITVTVTPVNDEPMVDNENESFPEDTSISGDLTDAGDSDPDGDNLVVNTTPIDDPNNGTIVINPDGTYTYTPDPDFNGLDTVVVTICDDATSPLCVNDTIFLIVTPVNDPPVIDNETHTTTIDVAVSGDVTDAGDFDIDGNLTVNTTPIDDPNNGTIIVNPDGTYTYTPNTGYVGLDTIVVEICDDGTPIPGICVNDTIFIEVIACDLAVATDDCDNDGLNNGEETTGVDDPTTPDTPNGNTSDPLNPDTDGDGVTDNLEGNDGTDPNDPCDLVLASQNVTPVPAWGLTDCDMDGLTNDEELTGVDNPSTPDTPNGVPTDPFNPDTDGDGVLDGTEGTDGTDPNDPCDLVVANITVAQTGDWLAADCDGDGVTNGDEINGPDGDPLTTADNTDPNDPCDFDVASQTLPVGLGWLTDDCDNDGLTNEEETTGIDDPGTPDTPNGNVTDPTNPDTDGDGVLDGTEGTDGTNPNDPCDLVVANITVAQTGDWLAADCDGDGVTNGDEINGPDGDPLTTDDNTDPNDPCDLDFASVTLTPSNAWLDLDCDNDGLTNGEETTGVDDPSTPDTPNGNVTDPTNPDSDGDGVTDGVEGTDGTDPTDPCDLVLANQDVAPSVAWGASDCDNDGLTNDEEIGGPDGDPLTTEDNTDPFNEDTDGDGVLDGDEVADGTNPNDPCDYIESSITVTVIATGGCDLFIPEAFTPNNDGSNDVFSIEGLDLYPDNEILILNRWGNKVYKSEGGYTNDWDGTNQFGISVGGSEIPVGTYFYILDLGEAGPDGEQIIKGYIYLNR